MSSSHNVIRQRLSGLTPHEAAIVRHHLERENAPHRKLYFDWITVSEAEDGSLAVEALPSPMSSEDIAMGALYNSVQFARYVTRS